MLQFILILLGLTTAINNPSTSSHNNEQPKTQLTNPTDGTDPIGSDGGTGGETIPLPPKK